MEDIFAWHNDNLGGTEVAQKWFHKNVLPKMKNIQNFKCISVPGKPYPLKDITVGKKNILWLHLTPNQVDDNGLNVLQQEEFKDSIHKIIAISNFHKKKISLEMNIDPDKIHVIEYPIEEDIAFDMLKFENVSRPKIIHASQSIRGLEVLLRVFEKIDEDFELNIYNDFYPEQQPENPKLENLLKDERITFYGKTPRATFLKELSKSHIHAYPSIFEETSCLVQAEAMLSGNLCVYSNFGALPETSLGHGIVSDFLSLSNMEDVVNDYQEKLTTAINLIKNGEFDPSDQIKSLVEYRGKEKIISKWVDFDNSLE
jgi:glycosyltransferase involved in cell wall biosynthesis